MLNERNNFQAYCEDPDLVFPMSQNKIYLSDEVDLRSDCTFCAV